jgi:hypothetical protein
LALIIDMTIISSSPSNSSAHSVSRTHALQPQGHKDSPRCIC